MIAHSLFYVNFRITHILYNSPLAFGLKNSWLSVTMCGPDRPGERRHRGQDIPASPPPRAPACPPPQSSTASTAHSPFLRSSSQPKNSELQVQIAFSMSETAAPAPASAPAAGGPQGTSAETTETTGGIIVHHLNNSRSQRILWLLVRYTFCPL